LQANSGSPGKMGVTTARRLTVADGVGEISDVVGTRQRDVVVGDDHVGVRREAGNVHQQVAVEPGLGGDRHERDAGLPAHCRLPRRRVDVNGRSWRQDNGEERHARPTFTTRTTTPLVLGQ